MGCELKWYAIREVAELTGVKPVTLRAWQRRYNLIKPQRTEKGHRLYSQKDVESIRQIQNWLAKGVAIGKVPQLLAGERIDALDEAPKQVLAECETLLASLAQLQRQKVQQTLSLVLKEYPLDIAESQLVEPVMAALEQVKAPLKTLQKSLFQSVMLSRLSAILESENKAAKKGRCLLVNLDSIGNLFAWFNAVRVSSEGWNVTLLDGVDDLSALIEHPVLEEVSSLVLFANRPVSDAQLGYIAQLMQRFNDHGHICGALHTFFHEG